MSVVINLCMIQENRKSGIKFILIVVGNTLHKVNAKTSASYHKRIFTAKNYSYLLQSCSNHVHSLYILMLTVGRKYLCKTSD